MSFTLQNHQLVFFPLACEHIVRAVRVLQQPGGHLMMVGTHPDYDS